MYVVFQRGYIIVVIIVTMARFNSTPSDRSSNNETDKIIFNSIEKIIIGKNQNHTPYRINKSEAPSIAIYTT